MKRNLFLSLITLCTLGATAQNASRSEGAKSAMAVSMPVLPADVVTVERLNPATGVKNQGQTGTCWCFSGTSLVESQFLKRTNEQVDLSEMYTVYNIYFEKARNYFLRQGHAQFGEGGLGHDVIRSIARYGAMPQSAFTGLESGKTVYNHEELVTQLKSFLDSEIIRLSRGDAGERWQNGVNKLLNAYIGTPPTLFEYDGKKYSAKTFASDYLHFNADDYVSLTSFTDHDFYKPFILSVPDNFANGSFYNIPMDEMTQVTKDALKAGYTVLWDADVSNPGFAQNKGIALNVAAGQRITGSGADVFSAPEETATPEIRQKLYEDLVTQDDHLMHITGLEKTKSGKAFFVVKNSWGEVGPYKGFINVSENYFDINTISIVVPKSALSKALLDKLHIQ